MATVTREEFLARRRQGLGGSDMAAIMGLSPWRSPMDVFRDKIGDAPENEANDAMYWGNQLEELVAQEFAKRTGYKIQRRTAQYQHPTIPYLIGNLDRLILNRPDGPEILEVKTTSAYGKRDWEGGQAPLHYRIQLMHYLDITGYGRGYLAVLIGGNDFRMVPVERDESLIAQMHAAAEAFWLCVETGTPPVVDGSQATADALKALYPIANGTSVELPEDALVWIHQRNAAKAAQAVAKAQLTEAENHLKALIGEADQGTLGSYTVTWHTAQRTDLDTKRLKAEQPDLVQQYTRTSPYRSLRVNNPDKKDKED